ncbi:MAG: ABC transporter ATP-binding protein [Desulfobacteraceae bacterium]|nr:ABC transporter ATP-binding protein [Desulfobacteraceae bacterium]
MTSFLPAKDHHLPPGPGGTSPEGPILEANGLVKNFREIRAVDGIDLAIGPGTCFGLLGPNGAGKTTAIEVIEGILAPTAGKVLYKGAPRGPGFRQEIGIQFQRTELPQFLSVRETLAMFRNLYDRRTPLPELIAACRLEEILDRDNRMISGGQRQRLFLAMALANDPELIFLDEPTTGLDPQTRRYLWEIIDRIKKAGKTIVLTTHYIEEAQLLCDQVAIMDRGRIIALGTPAELVERYLTGAAIVLPVPVPPDRQPAIPGRWRQRQNRTEIHTDDVAASLRGLLAAEVDLSGLTVRAPNLEDLFLQLTGRELRP